LDIPLVFFASFAVHFASFAVRFAGCDQPRPHEIIGAAIKVHRELGPGLLESAYEACLAYELQKLGMKVERQKPVPLISENVKLDYGFRADLVVESRVVVETKCKEALHPGDDSQLLSHIPLLNIPVGLLITFHVVVLRSSIRRLVNEYREPISPAI
jgi:GxxExxY protein